MSIIHGLFSSESVSKGHPDKLADRISDAILDEFLRHDPNSRVACETFLADQCVIVAGEFKTLQKDIFAHVREKAVSLVTNVLKETGYNDKETGIDPDRCEVQIRFNNQSSDISQGVDQNDGSIGAGDQGMMFGYACLETEELMPAPIMYAHRLMQQHERARQKHSCLMPDAKSQVTFSYQEGHPAFIETVVLSTQHTNDISTKDLHQIVQSEIITPIIPQDLQSPDFRILINPTGRFVIGGPKGDTGLTGRKIIVDTYGGAAPHGGGAFSGKDPSKVDRSAAYMARYLAKTIVSRGWSSRALVQLSYAIGVQQPVGVFVNTSDLTGAQNIEIADTLQKEFDLSPAGIIHYLNLKRPIYYPTAAYGHFGRSDLNLPWENIQPYAKVASF